MTYSLCIGHLRPKFPVLQGGMGVGISLSNLAGAVAKNGGIGVISSAQIGYREPNFMNSPLDANLKALDSEIKKAKSIAPKGIIGVNIMVALSHYEEMVQQAVTSGADLIISGAGLPTSLPSYVKNPLTKLVPIVSSGRAASILCKLWDKKNHTAPDAIVVEGPLAGGHLGFSLEALNNPPDVLALVEEVKKAIQPFKEKYQKEIPVIAAGGIYTGADAKNALANGADGVQMATRFVTTYECDAAAAYKQAYIDSKKEEIGIIKSPVGMPGRAILNPFIKTPGGNNACLYHCIAKCSVTDIPYCISKTLIAAAKGDLDHALLFCGSNAYRATHLESVEDIFRELEHAINC